MKSHARLTTNRRYRAFGGGRLQTVPALSLNGNRSAWRKRRVHTSYLIKLWRKERYETQCASSIWVKRLFSVAICQKENAAIEFRHSDFELSDNAPYYPDKTEAIYMCAAGYEYPDGSLNKISTCELGGVWRTERNGENDCKPTKCIPPPIYDFTSSNTTGDEYYTIGIVISYTCHDGYWFSAYEASLQYKYLACQSDKQWQGDVSHCSLKYCIRPVTPNCVTKTFLNDVRMH